MYSRCTYLTLRLFAIVLVFFTGAIIENYTVSIIAFQVIVLFRSFIRNLAARVGVFSFEEPFGTLPLILGAAIY